MADRALVGVKIYYAVQTGRTVSEMKRARAVAVMPKLIPSIHVAGPDIGWLRITNVGPGPALAADLHLVLEPKGWDVPWTAHVISSSESHDFIPTRPGSPTSDWVHLTPMTDEFTHLRLRGTYRDALGTSMKVDERVEIQSWWRTTKTARHLVPPDHVKDISKELEKIRRTMESMDREAERIRVAIEPEDPWRAQARWQPRVDRLPQFLRPRAIAVLRATDRWATRN